MNKKTSEHTRKFDGHRYALWNAFYGPRHRGALDASIRWAKQHGISYRTVRVKKPMAGVLLYLSQPA